MSDHHARSAREDVYDHEDQEPRSGRRRRPVADWGVGEDMFEQMPRNRFSRTAEAPPRERRFARGDAERPARRDDADRPASREEGEGPARREPRRDGAPHPPALDAEAGPSGPPRGGVEDGRRTLVLGKPEDVPSEIAAVTADRDLGPDVPPPPAEAPEAVPARRTVRIGGRPEGSLEAARYQRDRSRRPARTAQERIGARPDRIAMWAFALGLLLIAIAILTAM